MALELSRKPVVEREQPQLDRARAERKHPMTQVAQPSAGRGLDDAEPAEARPWIDAEDAQLPSAAAGYAESASMVFSSSSRFA